MDYLKFSENWEQFFEQINTKTGLLFFTLEVLSACTLFFIGFVLLLFFMGLGVQ